MLGKHRKPSLLVLCLVAALVSGGLWTAVPRSQASAPAQEADVTELVRGNTEFAFDLYHALRGQDGNLIVSPYSISEALAMTYAGARGDTEQQMADTLHFTLPNEQLHPAFYALDETVSPSEQRASPKEDPPAQPFRLHIANALWGQAGFSFLPDFLALVEANYRAGLQQLNFVSDPEAARETINDWVEDQTEDRIRDLLQPGTISGDTRLVLTNAIYFNAAWLLQFEEFVTSDQRFTRLDGSQVNVPMMAQTEDFGYAAGDGYQAVLLLYEGGQTAMLILLPDEGQFESFEAALDAGQLADIRAAIIWQHLALYMPRWEYTSEFGLAETLAALGMPDAFALDQADFSGMTGSRDLFISAVVHKAFVKVDESGTEAAAATAVVMTLGAAPMQEPLEVRIDRPFVYLILDQASGSILFMGRVLDPSAG